MADASGSKTGKKKNKKSKKELPPPLYLGVFTSRWSMYLGVGAVVATLLLVAGFGVMSSMEHAEKQLQKSIPKSRATFVSATPRPQPDQAEVEEQHVPATKEEEEAVIESKVDLTHVDPVALGAARALREGETLPYLKPILLSEAQVYSDFGRGNWHMALACHLPQYGYLPIFDPFPGGALDKSKVPDYARILDPEDPCAERIKRTLNMQREAFLEILEHSNYRRLPLPVIAPSWEATTDAWSATKNLIFTVYEARLMTREQFRKMMAFDVIFTASTYNARNIRGYGFKNVVPIRQGTSSEVFPALDRSSTLEDNRFIVFSGGKFEYRKGQDLVVEAFKRFTAAHPEANAQLVTAWVNHWPRSARTMQCSLYTDSYPVLGDENEGAISSDHVHLEEPEVEVGEDEEDEEMADRPQRLKDRLPSSSGEPLWDYRPWLRHNGLKDTEFKSSPIHLSKSQLRGVFSITDVAVFPNRCEAGTNMIASEALMSGLPVVISNLTGHSDLLNAHHFSGEPWAYPLNNLNVAVCNELAEESYITNVEEAVWGEPTIDEIVERLEEVYSDLNEANEVGRRAAEVMREHDNARKRVREFAAVLDEVLDESSWKVKGAKTDLEEGLMKSLEEAKKKAKPVNLRTGDTVKIDL